MTSRPRLQPPGSENDDLRIFIDGLSEKTKKLSDILTRMKKVKLSVLISGSLKTLASSLHNLTSEFTRAADLSEEFERRISSQFMQLEAALRERCETNRWTGWTALGPDFFVELAVPVHIDDKKRTVHVQGRACGIEDLNDSLRLAIRDLLPKDFSAEKFMSALSSAYDSLFEGEHSQIPILDLYKQMTVDSQPSRFWRDTRAISFVPFGIDQFRARLTRMLEAGVSTDKNGRELRLIPPLNPKDALFIYQPAERRFGFVGRIELIRLRKVYYARRTISGQYSGFHRSSTY